MTQPAEKKNSEANGLPVPQQQDDAACERHELSTAELLAVAGGPTIQNGE